VWRHELTADDLPETAFDLVHTRALLWQLPEPERALDQIVGALRPGGWVLIEEPDPTSETVVAQSGAAADLVDKVVRAKYRFLEARGFGRYFARRTLHELTARELTDVAAEGRVSLTRGGSPQARFFQLTMQLLSPELIAEGVISSGRSSATVNWSSTPLTYTCGRRCWPRGVARCLNNPDPVRSGPWESPADGVTIDVVVESDRAQLREIVQRVREGRPRAPIGNTRAPRRCRCGPQPDRATQGKDDHRRSSVRLGIATSI
jgi:hypothetical protein